MNEFKMNFRIGICPWCGEQFNEAEHSECDLCRTKTHKELQEILNKRLLNTQKDPLQPLLNYLKETERYLISLGWTSSQVKIAMREYITCKVN